MAFHQGVDIDCFRVLPEDVEEAIRSGNAGNFGLVVTSIGNLGYQGLGEEVVDVDDLVLGLEDDDVEVVPAFLIEEVVGAEGADS